MDYVTCMVLYNNKNRSVTKFGGKNYNGIYVYSYHNPEIYCYELQCVIYDLTVILFSVIINEIQR